MKKLVKCLAVAFFVLSASSLSYAKGIFIQPGARAAGYGQAFTAVADDLTAIFWNPAGLAYQKDTQAMMSAFYINYDATSNGPIFNKFQTSAILPFIAFSLPIDQSKKTILAAGIYISGGGGGKLEQLLPPPNPPVVAKIEGQYSYMIYNVSLAREIYDNLSVAVGVDLINMNEKQEFENLLYPNYSRSGYGVQGNVGVMYKPLKKLSTGIIFRSGSSISLSDVAGMDKHFKYPMTIEGGFAYNLFDRLTFACAVAHAEYSWTSADYVDTTIIKVGAEYKATDKLSILGGFYNDPNIYNTAVLYDGQTANVTNLNMYNMRYFNIGVGYKFTKSFNAVLLYSRSYTQPVSAVDPFTGILTEYKYPINFLKMDLNYKFSL
jgi:long-chain fatty acid transport protein